MLARLRFLKFNPSLSVLALGVLLVLIGVAYPEASESTETSSLSGLGKELLLWKG